MTTTFSLAGTVLRLSHASSQGSSHFHHYNPKNRPWAKSSPVHVWHLKSQLHVITTATWLCISMELEDTKVTSGVRIKEISIYYFIFEKREVSKVIWCWGIRRSGSKNEAPSGIWRLKDFLSQRCLWLSFNLFMCMWCYEFVRVYVMLCLSSDMLQESLLLIQNDLVYFC